MKKRSPIAVFVLFFITFGIHSLIWYISTGREMRKLGASIPTAWLIVIPFVGLYHWVKWCAGVAHVTRNRMSGVVAFLLTFFLGPIGYAMIQAEFNSVLDE